MAACTFTYPQASRNRDIADQMSSFRDSAKFTNIDVFSGCGTLVGRAHRSVLTSLSPVLAALLAPSASACACPSSACPATALAGQLAPTAIVLDGHGPDEVAALLKLLYSGHCHVTDLERVHALLLTLGIQADGLVIGMAEDDERQPQDAASLKRRLSAEANQHNAKRNKRGNVVSADSPSDESTRASTPSNSSRLKSGLKREAETTSASDAGGRKMTDGKPRLARCLHCTATFAEADAYKCHLAEHLSQTIREALIPTVSGDSACSVCSVVMARDVLVSHLAIDHDHLQLFLNEDEKNELRKVTAPSGAVQKKKEYEQNLVTMQCCGKLYAKAELRVHLLHKHFASDIVEKYGANGLECSLCFSQFPIKFALVEHLGLYHDKIKDFCTRSQAKFMN